MNYITLYFLYVIKIKNGKALNMRGERNVLSRKFYVIHYRISMVRSMCVNVQRLIPITNRESRCVFRRQVFTRKILLKSPRRKEDAKRNYGG